MEPKAHNIENQLPESSCESLCTNHGKVLSPITPDPQREHGEVLVRTDSPMTCVSLAFSVPLDSDSCLGHHTPKNEIFDPFAPGPDELNFAPRKPSERDATCFVDSKFVSEVVEVLETRERKLRVFRALNFDDCSDVVEGKATLENDKNYEVEDAVQEECFLESMYESFLDAIVSKQAEDHGLDENRFSLPKISSIPKTPTSLPLLKGVSDICPDAPTKPVQGQGSRVYKNLGSLCRKLEF